MKIGHKKHKNSQKHGSHCRYFLSLFVFFVAIISTRHGTCGAISQQTGFREPKVIKNGHKKHKKPQKGYVLTNSENLVTKNFEREVKR